MCFLNSSKCPCVLDTCPDFNIFLATEYGDAYNKTNAVTCDGENNGENVIENAKCSFSCKDGFILSGAYSGEFLCDPATAPRPGWRPVDGAQLSPFCEEGALYVLIQRVLFRFFE